MHDDPTDVGRPGAGVVMLREPAAEPSERRYGDDAPRLALSEPSLNRQPYLAIRALRLLAYISSHTVR